MNKPANIKPETVEDVLESMDRTLSADLVAAFAEIEGAAKDKINPAFRSKYADIGSVIDAIKPVLARHNLAFYQRPQPSEDGVLVQTLLRHSNGGEVDLGTLYVPANKKDAQGFGSALTYARRYALMTAFGVPAEDDDGNAAASSTKAANDRPTTGEAPPRKSAKLDGPYDTLPKLEKAAREFARTLRGLGSLADFSDLTQDKEVIAFVDQCKRDLPGWWFPNHPDCPPDFTPLAVEVATTKRGLEAMETAE